MNYEIKMLEGEYFWGGSSNDGGFAPYNKETELTRRFKKWASNQTMPMYLSNKGRCIWSENPFNCEIKDGTFFIDGEDVTVESFGSTLKDAYLGAMKKYFPPCGDLLEEDFFKKVQYNTWMQFTYDQTDKNILSYAKSIIENGFKPGILTIDEGWQKSYGDWTFDDAKFPNPKETIDELHKMGFKVMLWIVPYVSPNGLWFVRHSAPHFCKENHFLRTKDGEIAVIKWWNGMSAILDFTKQCDRDLLDSQLKKLMDDYGVDGFKFDGGSLEDYTWDNPINGEANEDFTPTERNIAWNDFGTKYRYHEYKDTFKGGGKRSIQRLRDKRHSWQNDGLNSLIPNAIVQGLLGHPFICPDMVGGGEWLDRALGTMVDDELFVRMAQCSALFPMMQFSWAPWESVDEEHMALIKAAHDLHNDSADRILKLVDDAVKTGEPILRPLEYNYPHCGYELVKDTFMLDEDLLVAPVINKGETVRKIQLPEGKWRGFDGKEYEGGKEISLPVTLADLPYFEKIK